MVALIAARALVADSVTLSNGDSITGSLVAIKDSKLLFDAALFGRLEVDQRFVKTLETEKTYTVYISQQEKRGFFEAGDGVNYLRIGDQISAIEIVAIQSAEPAKRLIQVLPLDLRSRLDLALVFSSGNSTTENFNALGESKLRQKNGEHKATFLRNTEKVEEITSKDLVDVSYGYKRFFSPVWYASLNTNFFRDELKDIDQRLTLSAGAGYQVFNTSSSALSTELGLSSVQERLAGENKSSPALRWGIDFQRYFLDRKAEAFYRQSLLAIAEEGRGQVITSSTGLRYALSDRVDAALRADLNYETNPPIGAESIDLTYSLGVGIRF